VARMVRSSLGERVSALAASLSTPASLSPIGGEGRVRGRS
jgi:hypothetical protein